jgi:hypothetical protein
LNRNEGSELTAAQTTKISWKDAEKALTKLYPRQMDDEDEDGDGVADAGELCCFADQDGSPLTFEQGASSTFSNTRVTHTR